MNRRGFLGSILALGAAPAIVRADSLMRLVPVDTLIALDVPHVGGNRLLTLEEITREALRIARDKARFIANVNRSYEAARGDTIKIRMPNRYGH